MYSNMYNLNQGENSLKQGNKFNNLHKDYLYIVGNNRLNLITQTSSPDLGSLELVRSSSGSLEPFTTSTRLEVLDNKLTTDISGLSSEYSTKLEDYLSDYEGYMKHVNRLKREGIDIYNLNENHLDDTDVKNVLELQDKIKRSNNELIDIAQRIYNKSINIKRTSDVVTDNSQEINGELIQKKVILDNERNIINNLSTDVNRLEGSMNDNVKEIKMDKLRYVAFILMALTMGGLSYHILRKK